MVLLLCKHCNYRWDYDGKNEHYATCPKCRYKVKIPKDKVDILKKKERELKIKNDAEDQQVKLLGIAGIVNKVVKDYHNDECMLIQILLKLQSKFGWLSRGMMTEVSKQLKIPFYKVYQATTFYKKFSLEPKGRHAIKVCMGTSCKVKGASKILDEILDYLNIDVGETTYDRRFSVETSNCMGCCSIGPVITVDGKTYGILKSADLVKILSNYR